MDLGQGPPPLYRDPLKVPVSRKQNEDGDFHAKPRGQQYDVKGLDNRIRHLTKLVLQLLKPLDYTTSNSPCILHATTMK